MIELRAVLVPLVLCVEFAACGGNSSVATSNAKGPPGTFKELLSSSTPGGLFIVTINGERYIEAQGSESSLLASGPPGYVYNSKGALVDWASDCQEDSDYQNQWHYAKDRHRATPGELKEFLSE